MKQAKYIGIIFILFVLGLPYIYQPNITETLKLRTFDQFVPSYEPSGYFSILNITEDDVAQEGGYPFPRKRLAEIQNELVDRGALGVGWVIAFPQEDRFGGDLEFAQSLASTASIVATFENENGKFPMTTGTVILGQDRGGFMAKGVIENIPIIRDSAFQGIAVAPTEVDQLVRRMPLLLRTPDGWVSAYGTEVLKVLTGADTYLIKTSEAGIQEIRVKGLPPVKTDTLGRKWISWVNTPEFSLADIKNTDLIRDRFIFIGITAKGIMPQIATPIGLVEPHKIQSALSESILIENSPMIPDYALLAEIGIYALSVALIWLLLHSLGITLGLISAISVMATTAYFGWLFISQGILIDVTWALISQFITGSIGFYLRFREQWKLRKQIKGQFGSYISPEYVDIIVKDPSLMKLGGDRKEMTFLFSDIVGFTPISEKYMQKDDPEGLVELINYFLDEMTKIIIKNGGTIDKYMGDCIMAFWNAPIPCPEHAHIAVKTAMEIELLCEKLNKEFKDMPPIMFGTGINTGTCIVGNMGSEMRLNYSVIGDAVNLGARLEVQTRAYDTPILISQYTYQQLRGISCIFIDELKVKGKEEPVKIYAPRFEDAYNQKGIRKLKK